METGAVLQGYMYARIAAYQTGRPAGMQPGCSPGSTSCDTVLR